MLPASTTPDTQRILLVPPLHGVVEEGLGVVGFHQSKLALPFLKMLVIPSSTNPQLGQPLPAGALRACIRASQPCKACCPKGPDKSVSEAHLAGDVKAGGT